MNGDKPIIYVVDDDPNILTVTQDLLASNIWDIVCLTQAADFLDVYRPERAGCLVLDLQMPGINGLELQRTLSDWGMDVPIVFITGGTSIENTVTALKAGAQDFIQKPFQRETLITTIDAALESQATQREEKRVLALANQRFEDLTEREWEVLSAMLSGPSILSGKEVAEMLEISHRTVEHHRARIMYKTRCASLAELVRLASFVGIAEPNSLTEA